MHPDPARSPAWYGKPFTLAFPVGIIAVVAFIVVGAITAGGVGIATRTGDLSAMDDRVTTEPRAFFGSPRAVAAWIRAFNQT
ncbi:MAG: hypothetical protein V4850_33030 [Myxococcota bacterium]